MALKATIFTVELSIADIGRNVYGDSSPRLARHPSENDARMMVRLSPDAAQALAGGTMNLECTIQEGEVLIAGESGAVRVAPAALFSAV